MVSTNNNVTKYALIAAFGGFVFGLDAANLSGAVRYISSYFELTSSQVGFVAGITLWGVIFALFFTGMLCEWFGRKKVLIAIAIGYALSSLLSATAVSYEMLAFGRFIGGLAFASITVSAMYVGEITPPSQRGKFVSVNQFMIALGLLLAFIINYFLLRGLSVNEYLNGENVWRFMLGSELVANVIWLSLLFLVPESPRWLLKKGREEEARQAFSKLVPADQIESTVVAVRESLSKDNEANSMREIGGQLKTLFSGRMRLVLAIAVVYAITQGATGMNAVLFFAPMIFEQVGMSVEDTFMQTVSMGVFGLVATVIAIFSIERLGRRFLTLAGLALVIIAHTSTWYSFSNATYDISPKTITEVSEILIDERVDVSKLNKLAGTSFENDVALKAALANEFNKSELPLVTGPVINASINGVIAPLALFGIFLFLAAFNLSIGPIMWVIFSEIFPNKIRSVAMPVAALVQTISSILVTQPLPWLLDVIGTASVFMVYALVGVVGFAVMFFILPETKGKSIEMIEKDLVRT